MTRSAVFPRARAVASLNVLAVVVSLLAVVMPPAAQATAAEPGGPATSGTVTVASTSDPSALPTADETPALRHIDASTPALSPVESGNAAEEPGPIAPAAKGAEPSVAATAEPSAAATEQLGTVSGVVTDEAGKPAGSVWVWLHELSGTDENDNTLWGSSSRSARTDATGRYIMSAVPAGTYTAHFEPWSSPLLDEWWDDERDPSTADSFILEPGGAELDISAQLTAGASLSGAVRDSAGVTVSAWVTLYRQREDFTGSPVWDEVDYARADAAGRYSFVALEPGTYTLGFEYEGVEEWWNDQPTEARSQPIVLAASQTTPGLDAVLDVTGSVSGIVTRSDGTAAAFHSVWVVRAESNGAGEWSEGRYYSGMTDSRGAFEVRALPPGTYTVWVPDAQYFVGEYWGDAPDFAHADRFAVEPGETRAGVDVELARGSRLSGTVTDPTSSPLADAYVDLYRRVVTPDGSLWTTVDSRQTDAMGGFSFDGLPAGSYTLHYAKDGKTLAEWWNNAADQESAQVIEVGAGDDKSGLDAQLAASLTVSGMVSKAGGVPVDSALVALYGRDPGSNTWRELDTTHTGATGRYTFGELSPGTYTLRFSDVSGLAPEWWNDATEPNSAAALVLVSKSADHIDAELVGGASIAGAVTAIDGGSVSVVRVTAFRQEIDPDGQPAWEDAATVTPDSAGRYVIASLPPGRYTLAFDTGESRLVPEVWNGEQGLANADSFLLPAGGSLAGLDARLELRAKIGGTVSVAGGTPDIVRVRAYRQIDGRLWTLAGAVWANASGSYSITGLLPGRYAIQFSGYGLITEWWDDQPSLEDSTSFELRGNDDTRSVDADVAMAPVLDSKAPAIVGEPLVGRSLASGTLGWAVGTTFAYQWNVNGLAVPGADALTLELTGSHVGKRISVTVTGSKPGYRSVTRTSEQTPVVASATLTAVTPVIVGEAAVGLTLAVLRGAWTPGTTFAYQWFADGATINGATTSTLALKAEHAGTRVTVAVVGSKSGYTSTSRESAATTTVTGGILSARTPTVHGLARVGESLWGEPGFWTDRTSFTYRWFADGVEIAGAETNPLVVTAALLGKAITFEATGSRPGFTTETRLAEPTPRVVAGLLSSSAPTITGTVAVGSALNVVATGWTAGATLSYQWLANGARIAGATTSNLVLTSALKDREISVKVTGVLTGYTSASRTSVATARVATAGTPTVTGSARVGSTLTAVPGTWSASTSFTYQWLADGAVISGATKSTFVPTSAQDSKAIAVRVTGKKSGYATVLKTSASTLRVMRSSTPTISGTMAVGFALTAKPNTWSAGTAFTYQWFANGVAIGGATTSTFTPGAAQRDKQITVRVVGKKSGTTSVSALSSPTAKVATTSNPSIAGNVLVGGTLTAKSNTWTPGTSFRYQWYADGVAVSGATASTFRISKALVGQAMTVRVTGAHSGYQTISRTSAPSAVVKSTR